MGLLLLWRTCSAASAHVRRESSHARSDSDVDVDSVRGLSVQTTDMQRGDPPGDSKDDVEGGEPPKVVHGPPSLSKQVSGSLDC